MFASCLPGLEELLRGEVESMGAQDVLAVPGGVTFTGGLPELYRANLCLGLATHVLLRVAEFPTRHLSQLRKKADALPWRDLLTRGQPFTVRATCRRSKLYHSGAVAERVAQAIASATGAEPVTTPVPEGGDIPTVAVRVHEDMVSISLDTSGEPLHRRGWRLQTAKAPLREDLARALLLATQWEPTTPLVDPMTGSGTLAIEAAVLARDLAPGRGRSFAFEKMPLCDSSLLAGLRSELAAKAQDRAPAPIFASDRDAGAIDAARANAERAGVADDIDLRVAPFSEAAVLSGVPVPGEHGAIVCNPPYGRRLGHSDKLPILYQAFGHTVQRLPAGWKIGLCTNDRRLALRTGLPLRTAFLTSHGGLKVRGMVCDVG